jgi:hypothetical protein
LQRASAETVRIEECGYTFQTQGRYMQISYVTVKRDPEYFRLAKDLRFEAARAALGHVVDEVKGIPAGKAYGSHHEAMLKSSEAYRYAYSTAMLGTADLADIRGVVGSLPKCDEPTAPRGLLTTVRDPHTGEPIAARRALDDTPLNRARYASAEPISDLQWLAGTQYEADCAGEVPYRGNAALIEGNGALRMQAVADESIVGRENTPSFCRHKDSVVDRYAMETFDGEELISYDPSSDMVSHAGRLSKVTRGLTQDERTMARRWLCEHRAGYLSRNIKDLLDRLVSLYSAHDEDFAFQAWRHTFSPQSPDLIEAANDNRAPRARRKSKRS